MISTLISARHERNSIGAVIRQLCRLRDPSAESSVLSEAVGRCEPSMLLGAASHHRLSSCLYIGLKPNLMTCPPQLVAGLSSHYMVQTAHHLRTMADFRHCAETLDAAGIAWVSFKGPVLAETVYPRPDMRVYGDLDIAVAADDVEASVEALFPKKPTEHLPSASLAKTTSVHQVSLVLPYGTNLDLHWDLLSLGWARRDFPMSLREFLDSRVAVEIDGFTIRTFDAEHSLIHLIAHAGLSGGHRGLWLKDIAETVRTRELDWDAVVTLAARMNLSLMSAVMLARVSRLACVTPPPGVIGRLGGHRPWPRAVQLSDRVRKPEEGMGTGASGQLLVRSTRATSWQSFGKFAAGERRTLLRRLRAGSEPKSSQSRDAT